MKGKEYLASRNVFGSLDSVPNEQSVIREECNLKAEGGVA